MFKNAAVFWGVTFALITVVSLSGHCKSIRAVVGMSENQVITQYHPPHWMFVGDRWLLIGLTFFDDFLGFSLGRNLGGSGLTPHWFSIGCSVLPIRIGIVRGGIEVGLLGYPTNPMRLIYIGATAALWSNSIGATATLGFEWARAEPAYWCLFSSLSVRVDVGEVFSLLFKRM